MPRTIGNFLMWKFSLPPHQKMLLSQNHFFVTPKLAQNGPRPKMSTWRSQNLARRPIPKSEGEIFWGKPELLGSKSKLFWGKPKLFTSNSKLFQKQNQAFSKAKPSFFKAKPSFSGANPSFSGCKAKFFWMQSQVCLGAKPSFSGCKAKFS